MKKLTGTVQTTTQTPTTGVTPKVPSMPTVTPQNLVTLLTRLRKDDDTPLVTLEQSNALASLRFKHANETVLTLQDRYFVFEVINMLNSLSYEQVYNFLSTDWETIFRGASNLRKKILFENPLLSEAKEKLELDMEIFRNKVDVAKGAVDCKKCGSDETLSVEKQTRSSDEPMTIMVTCLQCGHKWRAQ